MSKQAAELPGPVSADFTITQNQSLNLQITNAQIKSVVVQNLTPFFLHFPDNPAGYEWVLPNTNGTKLPVRPGDRIRVNTVDTPPGVSVPSSSLSAKITATEEVLGFAPGVPFGTAPNLVPNKTPALISGVIANNAAFSIVAGVTGQLVYAFDVNLGYDAVGVGAVFLEDDSGAPTNWHAYPSATLIPSPFHGQGAQFAPMGFGIRLFNSSGGSLTMRGSAIYSQA